MKQNKLAAIYVAILLLTFTAISTPITYAASLTEGQINAIIGLLSSFGADQTVINNVNTALRGIPTPP